MGLEFRRVLFRSIENEIERRVKEQIETLKITLRKEVIENCQKECKEIVESIINNPQEKYHIFKLTDKKQYNQVRQQLDERKIPCVCKQHKTKEIYMIKVCIQDIGITECLINPFSLKSLKNNEYITINHNNEINNLNKNNNINKDNEISI